MAYLVAVVAGLAFGAIDQYLGTLAAGSVLGTWSWTVSGMSAPWLVLPFVAGATQNRPRRGAAIGLVVTLSALAGYFAMTYSPLESIPIREFWSGVVGMVTSPPNPEWILAGAITGPLMGYLGHRWRVARSWVGAAIITTALVLEPVARSAVGRLERPPQVWATEIAVGIVAGVTFAWIAMRSRAGAGRSPDGAA
jgi:hypothetical protein